MTVPPLTDDQALDTAFKSYVEFRQPGYDPNAMTHHFDGFRVFADSVIGDGLRKIKDHLFPKVQAAGVDGISIGNVSILPYRSHEGKAYELVVRTNGIDLFILRTMHTSLGHGRTRPTDTVVLLRAGAQLGITHASMLAPDEAHAWWRYKVYDGPGAIPGLVEACELILPFIAVEAASDTVSRDLHVGFAEEYMELVARDGGLPGKLVAKFGQRVMADGMGAIFDWLATELPKLAEKVGDRMTWPENSLHYNDQDESAAILRAPGAVGIVQFIGPAVADPNYASMQVLRLDDKGAPRHAETYLIPIGDGELVRVIEAFRAGEPLDDHISMTFDYGTREASTTPAFLEAKQYHDVGSTVFYANIDWKGRREENFVEGVDRFREYDGLSAAAPAASAATPSL